jgi:hypothetical protein
LDELNIAVEIIVPYAHRQHGRIERHWGTLVPMTQSMTRQAALTKSYWALAITAAVHVRNRVHSSAAGGVPFTLATGIRADLSSMRVFGCRAYVHVDKSQRRKLDDRAWGGVSGLRLRVTGVVGVKSCFSSGGEQPERGVRRGLCPLHRGEQCGASEQRNDDEEDNTPPAMCSEEPDTPLGESPLRQSLQHSGSTEDERDMHSGETPRPRYSLRSTASPQQCVPSPRYNFRSTKAPGDEWTAGSTAAIKPTNRPIVQEHVSYKQALRSPQSGRERQL